MPQTSPSLREKVARILRADNSPHAPALREYAAVWLANRILALPEIREALEAKQREETVYRAGQP